MQLRMKEEMSEQLLLKIGNIYFAAFPCEESLKKFSVGLSDPVLLLPGA